MSSLGAPARTIANVFDAGLMKQVTGYADITYLGNGLINTITHKRASGASGPVWTQTSNQGITRPQQIQITGQCDDLAITTQPADHPVTAGDPAGLTVGAAGAVTYQWYEQLASGAILLDQQTTNTLTTPITTQRRFWVRVSNGTCTIDSVIATVSVTGGCTAPSATISASSAVNGGATVSASVPSTSGATYAWTITGGTFTSPANGNSVTYTAGCSGQVALNVTVRASCGTQGTGSFSATIAPPSATILTTQQTIDPGAAAHIDVALTGTPPWSIAWQDGFTQANISSSPVTRTPHPSETTTYTVLFVSDSTICDGAVNGSAEVIVRPPAPVSVFATATSPTSVNVHWNLSESGTTFVIYRSSGGGFTPVGTSATLQYEDTAVQPNTAYLYCVQAMRGNLGSPLSAVDLATTVIVSDDPLLASTTLVRAAHITQLRTAVNAARTLAGLPLPTYTDPSLAAGTLVKAVHVSELRAAINAARQSLSVPAIIYNDPPPAAGFLIKATDVMDLRWGVQ